MTHAGNSEGSQVSPDYMLSGLPKVALDRLPGVMPTHDFPVASGEKLVLGMGSYCWWEIPGQASSPSHRDGGSHWQGLRLAVAAHSLSTPVRGPILVSSLLLSGRDS